VIYAGIDYSTHAVDVVTVRQRGAELWEDWQTHTEVQHHRVEFEGDNAWARAFDAAEKLDAWEWTDPVSDHLYDASVIVIEEPAGSSRLVAQQLARVQGLIIANLPRIDGQVWGMVPSEWKKLVVGKGNASKEEVKQWAEKNMLGTVVHNVGGPFTAVTPGGSKIGAGWPQDAYDAYCMALAGAKRSG